MVALDVFKNIQNGNFLVHMLPGVCLQLIYFLAVSEGNNIGALSKMLNVESNNMEYKSKDTFQIPHLKDF